MKVLIVLTSNDQLGNTGKKTGFWLEEFVAPYYYLIDNGVEVTLASPKGGQPPLDPKSDEPDAQTEHTKRFKDDKKAQDQLANTHKLSEVKADDYDAVFYPGGHGLMWDLHSNEKSINLIEDFIASNKPVSAVCHAPAVLIKAKDKNGEPLVKGKKVCGYTNSEEEATGLTDVVPFLLEDKLKEMGGDYQKTDDWGSIAVTDGLLITGQNPQSSEAVAKKLLEKLK